MNLGFSLPVERLSATAIASLIVCPNQYRLKYLHKQEEKLFGARFLGIVDHSVHEGALNYKIASGKNLTMEELETTFAQEWDSLISREGEPDWGQDDPSKSYDRQLAAVRLYHEKVGMHLDPLAVEEWIEFTVPGVPVPIVGKLDVTCSDRVIDRKTSATKLSKPKPNWRLQAQVYSYATELPVEFQLITKQATPQIVTAVEAPEMLIQPCDRTETEYFIRQAALMLSDFHSRYGADNTWPTFGKIHQWACDFCRHGPKYEATCPAWA